MEKCLTIRLIIKQIYDTKRIYLTLVCNCNIRPDTIDYWHVKYNGKLIKEYNIHAYEKIINLKSAEIKTNDSISVLYGNDRPCRDCAIEIVLFDNKNRKHIIANAKGTFNPISFSLKNAQKLGGNRFDIYYHDPYDRKQYLFTIKIE